MKEGREGKEGPSWPPPAPSPTCALAFAVGAAIFFLSSGTSWPLPSPSCDAQTPSVRAQGRKRKLTGGIERGVVLLSLLICHEAAAGHPSRAELRRVTDTDSLSLFLASSYAATPLLRACLSLFYFLSRADGQVSLSFSLSFFSSFFLSLPSHPLPVCLKRFSNLFRLNRSDWPQ